MSSAPSSKAAPPPAKSAQRPSILREDAEFLPAALEILETPPSPNKIAFLLAICAFATVSLVWSYFGRVDIIASAHGKIQPTGRVKKIQPSETARVTAILVHNGQAVKEGEVLLELEASDALAEHAAASAGHAAYRAEGLRRRAAIQAATAPEFAIAPIQWPGDIPAANRSSEEQVLMADVAMLAGTVASLDAQIRQKEAEGRRLSAMMDAQGKLVEVLQKRVDMRSSLVRSGAGAVTGLMDAQETLGYHSTNYAMTKGQVEEAAAGAQVLVRERAKTIDMFIANNQQKLADADRQSVDFEQKVAKTKARLSHLTIVSPIAGTVAASSVTTIGQVVTVGEEVMRIVPSGAGLEIEAYLENKDVGFVKPGQKAEVKVEAFPFTRYGTLGATVTRVSTDAIPERDAQQSEADPSRATRSTGFAGSQRTQNLVYLVTLTPNRSSVMVEGVEVPLSAGMTTVVEITTGSRRILEYVFSPLVETASKALRER